MVECKRVVGWKRMGLRRSEMVGIANCSCSLVSMHLNLVLLVIHQSTCGGQFHEEGYNNFWLYSRS